MTLTERETARAALTRAIAAAGGSTALAREIGIRPPAVSQWEICPPLRVIAVEAATGVSRHDLRPDLHPRPAADHGTYIGLSRGCHEMDRDADRAGVNAPVMVAAENALEAPGNRAGRVNHAGPDESSGAKLNRPLARHERLTADGDRIRLSQREA